VALMSLPPQVFGTTGLSLILMVVKQSVQSWD